MSTPQQHVIRQLGITERNMSDWEKERECTQVEMLKIRTRQELRLDLVIKALRCHELNYPIMRTRIIQENGREFFVFRESDDIDFEFLKTTDWREASHQMLETSFNEERGPLWKARLMTDDTDPCVYHFIFVAHHSIADGLAGVVITQRIMELIDSLLNGEDVNTGVIQDVLPALEDFLPMRDFVWSEMLPVLRTPSLRPAFASFREFLKICLTISIYGLLSAIGYVYIYRGNKTTHCL